MTRAPVLFALALLAACADPPPEPSAPPTSATIDGIQVRVGGREVVVHCALTCPAAEAELTQLSSECVANPSSGPHRVSAGGALLTMGCCEEASLAFERACGHEGLPGCAARWAGRCQGVSPIAAPVDDSERGVTTGRGL